MDVVESGKNNIDLCVVTTDGFKMLDASEIEALVNSLE